MEEGESHCAIPHLCPPPDLPPANERWFKDNGGLLTRTFKTAPDEGATMRETLRQGVAARNRQTVAARPGKAKTIDELDVQS